MALLLFARLKDFMIFVPEMEKRKRTVSFHTLGCKLNFSETSEIGRKLEEDGFERVDFGEEAEVSVIHTCSVTGSADRKTRQAIKKAIKASPEGFIVAMGCYAQLRPEEMAALDGVDLILGTRDKFDLPKYLNDTSKKEVTEIHSCGLDDLSNFFPAYSIGERTRAFLKVQDGCDYSCSYCTIPRARGKSRNPRIETLLEQAVNIANQGIKEIVLTGVNIGDFGQNSSPTFSDLVRGLDGLDIGSRFRISSIEPNLLSDEIINITARASHFTPHFHIPLQSGSDKILKLMRRRYLRETFENRVRRVKSILPDACIGADVIVGFPGESDAEFQETIDFIDKLDISYLHVFTYSERPGTPATNIKPIVPNRIRDDRSKILHQLSEKKKKIFYLSQKGKTGRVIFERKTENNTMIGFTENYIEVEVPYEKDYLNQEKEVELIELKNSRMQAKIITP